MEKIIRFIFIAAIFVFSANNVFASDLVILPVSGSSSLGKTFSVEIDVTNNIQAINAVSGTLSFPADLVAVRSISKDGSIIKLWAEEPGFSNNDGTVHFEGVILNPGFSGSKGKVLTITFVSKRSGKTPFLFTSGSILANDGQGTSVLDKLGVSAFTISPDTVSTDTTTANNTSTTQAPTANPLLPAAAKIVSETHPSSTKWYSNNKPTFSWSLPSDVTAVRLLYDHNASSIPVKTYSPAVASKNITDSVEDGVYYFHVQFKNSFGWGEIAHYRFQIDTKDPDAFEINFPHGAVSDEPQPIIHFASVDRGSGIDHYEIRIGDGDPIIFTPTTAATSYTMSTQTPGAHTLVVKAIDAAGNSTTESTQFTIASIKPPVITTYPQELQDGDLLKIRGTTYPLATVNVSLKNGSDRAITESTKSDESGNFSIFWSQKINPGVYKMTAQATDARGAKSAETDALTIAVGQKALTLIGLKVLNYSSIAIMIIIAVGAILACVWYVISRFTLLRRRIRRELLEVETSVHDEFKTVKADIESHIAALERARTKRKLSDEEIALLEKLEHYVDVIEKNIVKKIDTARREV